MEAELGRLLIVDDETAIAELVYKAAIEIGYTAKIVSVSSDFEPLLLQWHPSAIMLDLIMPERDGMQLIDALAELGFPGDLIIISGADPIYVQTAAARASARGLKLAKLVMKPFRKSEIQQLLHQLREMDADRQ